MGKVYSIKEEEIMCRTYLDHPNDWRKHMDELMQKLNDAGFKDCVRKDVEAKMNDYNKIATKKDTSHCARKSIQIYKKMKPLFYYLQIWN